MKRNYLFLGFAIPEEEMKTVFGKDQFPSIQTHKFNWNLIKGLENLDGVEFTYISTRPVSDFPYYPHKFVKRKRWATWLGKNEIIISEIPFINISLLKIITRTFSGLVIGILKYFKLKNKAGVVVYSVHVPYMLVGYIISKIFKVELISIWTDPPAVLNTKDSSLKRNLRKLEYKLSIKLMSKTDKVIAVTKYLAHDFAPNKPFLVIEGIVDIKDINRKSNLIKSENKKTTNFVYTGTLDARYGIKNLIQAFEEINDRNIVLDVYGKGDFQEELEQICAVSSNIRYKGFVANDQALKAQRDADFLINTRSDEDEYVKYSFPSKTLEYMLSGTPLITTILSGMPNEYENYVIPLKDNSVKSIKETISESIEMTIDNRIKLGKSALKFAESKNYNNQALEIFDFLDRNN